MSRVSRLLRLPGHASRAERDVDDELAFHIAMREETLRAAGLTDVQARVRARERFGDVASIRDECLRSERRLIQRERRMTRGEELFSDLHQAFRSARRAGGFTITALVTIALGIGATTAVFTIVNAVLVRPLPYPDADRIVRVYGATNNWDSPLSSPTFRDLRAQAHTLTALGGYVWNEATVTGIAEPVRAMTASVYGDFFGAVGVRPALGRALMEEETRIGAPRRAVVSHDFWVRHLRSERTLDGLHVTLRGGSYDVVGVMPPGFGYPNRSQIWIGSIYADTENQRSSFLWSGVGRLRPGVTVDAARAEVDGILTRVATTYGRNEAGISGGRVKLLRDALVGNHRAALVFLLGAVSLVLLIACVNVATAALARGEAKRIELGIRVALGAGRPRLVRQALTEHMAVALLGGIAGCGLAIALTRFLGVLGPRATGLPRLDEVRVDSTALAFAVLATMVAGLAIGLLPAWHASRADLRGVIVRGGRGVVSDASRARRLLVTTEVALAIAITVGAGMLIRSLGALMSGEPGFDPRNVATVDVSLPESKYTSETRVITYFDELLAAIRATPSVRQASIVNSVPYAGNQIGGGIATDVEPDRKDRGAFYRLVGDGYFETLRIPVLQGRGFGPDDDAASQPVVVVSRAFAKMAWPNANPIGRRIKWTPQFDNHDDWLTVVGVVENIKGFAADDGTGPAVYLSYRQRPERALEGVSVLVSHSGNLAPILDAVRRRMRILDPDVPVEFSSMESIMARSVAYRRFIMLVMSGFGVFALFLAALGVYGVLAYAVARRNREIGVRMALGAGGAQIVRLIARDASRSILPGIVFGVVGAVLLTRTMRTMLYGIEPTDPIAFLGALAALVMVAMLAFVGPARRAARVDPLTVMRAE